MLFRSIGKADGASIAFPGGKITVVVVSIIHTIVGSDVTIGGIGKTAFRGMRSNASQDIIGIGALLIGEKISSYIVGIVNGTFYGIVFFGESSYPVVGVGSDAFAIHIYFGDPTVEIVSIAGTFTKGGGLGSFSSKGIICVASFPIEVIDPTENFTRIIIGVGGGLDRKSVV